MSCCFDLYERLKIDAPVDPDVVWEWEDEYLPEGLAGALAAAGMQCRLAELGKQILLGDGIVLNMKIRLVGDGEVYEFSGGIITEQYQNIIRKLSKMKSVDLTVDYTIRRSASNNKISIPLLDSAAEQNMQVIVQSAKENNRDLAEVLRGVTYQVWCWCDNSDEDENLGRVSTYGELDGMVYDGENRQLDWKDLPDGKMEIPWMFNFSMEHPGKEEYDRYKRLAERHPNLMDVPGEYDPDNCSVYNDMADLYLPGGKADFDATMEIAQELLHLPNDAYTEEEKELTDGFFQNTYFRVKGVDEDGFVYFADAVLHAEAPVQILSVKR